MPESMWPWPTTDVATTAGRIAVTDAGRGPTLLLVHVPGSVAPPAVPSVSTS